MQLDVDGETVEVRDTGTLLDALREDAGRVCVKDGCAPAGQCGACSVLIDGDARLACVTPVARARDRRVTTADGLAEPLRSHLADAFCARRAFDCGFCTPGIVVRAHALLSAAAGTGVDVDRAAIDRALLQNLCRCTGWQPVVDAIADVAAGRSAPPGDDTDVPLGGHRFLADVDDADVWAVPVVAGVSSGTLDAVEADGPLLDGDALAAHGRSVVRRAGERIGDAGDIVAVAIGDTLSAARAVAATVRIVLDGDAEAADGAVPAAAAAHGTADAVDWTTERMTPAVDPGFLEPEAASAAIVDGVVTVRSQTEDPGGTTVAVAAALGSDTAPARVELDVVTNGGSYGGKVDPTPALLAALAARALDARVTVVFGRAEAILWHARRHPVRAAVTLDHAPDGALRRIDGVLESVGGGVDAGANPYRVATSVTSRVVPGRPAAPLRGDGVAHWTFARERALDAAGVDRGAVAHPVGAAAFAALAPCDGNALAGGDRCAVAAGVDLDDDGRIVRIRLVAGGVADTAQHRADLVSGASMGLGMALSEQVPLRDDVPTPATIRSLGLLRCGQTPPFDVDFVATEETTDATADVAAASPQHDVYALAATVAAVAAAVRGRGDDPVTLPMTDSAPAAALRRR